jgi:hypothetical protein
MPLPKREIPTKVSNDATVADVTELERLIADLTDPCRSVSYNYSELIIVPLPVGYWVTWRKDQ